MEEKGLIYGHFVSLNFIWRTNHSSPSSDMLPYGSFEHGWSSCLREEGDRSCKVKDISHTR